MVMELRPAGYSSVGGIRMNTVPWRLYEKAKQNFWDPARIDFSQDARDWADLTPAQRTAVARLATLFMVGEEAVTLDILPLLEGVADEGRLEETIYLSSFVFDEAKHVEFFRRWFDAVGFDESFEQFLGPSYRRIFDEELPRSLQRLRTDRSPEAFLDAGLVYNQFVEGVLALTGYWSWERIFAARRIFPGMQEGLVHIQRDERRHIAYGTYLCRRVIAAHPELWPYVERRMAQLGELAAALISEGQEGVGEAAFEPTDPDATMRYAMAQLPRRLEVIEVARTQAPAEVDVGTMEEDLEDALAASGDASDSEPRAS